MANHEVIFKCKKCGANFDGRVHGFKCPDCQTIHPNSYTFSLPISHAALIGAGFVKEEYFDRDLSDFDNIRVEMYKKQLHPDIILEVCFYYHAETAGDFELKESSVQLQVGDDAVIELNYTALSDIIKFCDTLIKAIKR